jgi:hypothetical protein
MLDLSVQIDLLESASVARREAECRLNDFAGSVSDDAVREMNGGRRSGLGLQRDLRAWVLCIVRLVPPIGPAAPTNRVAGAATTATATAPRRPGPRISSGRMPAVRG